MTDRAELDQPSVVARRADQLQIDAGPRDDPFEATLVLSAGAGPDPTAVALTLTPSVLGDLLTALHQVKSAQLEQLGIQPTDEKPAVNTNVDQDDQDPHEESSTGLQRLHRAADPLGLRHLRGRKPSPTILAVLALAFLALTLILQVVQR